MALVSQWIALNALYGQWDHGAREPVADRECWRVFMDRLVDLDRSGYQAQMPIDHAHMAESRQQVFLREFLETAKHQPPIQD